MGKKKIEEEKKKKLRKGFTLIELLSVILILGIIALIAIPVVTNIIEESKKGAAQRSADGFINAVENQVAIANISENIDDIEDGTYTATTLFTTYNVSLKGTKPTDDSWVTISDGLVTYYSLVESGYVVTKGQDTIKGESPMAKPKTVINLPAGLEKGTPVYMEAENKYECDATDAVSTTGTKTGCMKWYVYKDNGDGTYQLILDHNTTPVVAYNSDGINTSMKELATTLATDISTWDSSLNARLITAEEVAEITGNTTATTATSGYYYLDSKTTTASTTCTSGNTTECKYGWLYDRTSTSCKIYGCLYNADIEMTGSGFWLSTRTSDSNEHAWSVNLIGKFNAFYANSVSYAGVRPVITV